MQLDLLGEHAARAYPILASLVTPRPIAWVTTLNEDGSVNAAPFSFFNVFGSRPPMLAFAPGDRPEGGPKDTARNLERSGEFVVNLVDEDSAAAMVATAASLPYGESELAAEGLATEPSRTVAPPRISGVPAALECRVHSIQRIGGNRLVIGLVQGVEVRDGLFDPAAQRIRHEHLRPLGRMASPDWYCRTTERFELCRPE